jgi:molybdate transport system substrate-binding protein
VRSLSDLARGGLRLAVGSAGVPVGVYTRALLRRAGAQRVLRANRVSDEPTVASIAAKVRLGSADAGFVYRTDARLARGALRVVPLPAAARPSVLYEACAVVRPGARSPAARAFLDALQSPRVQKALVAQGFGRRPASPRSG